MLSKGGIPFELNLFRPAEAAEMTGLSALMQRDWRDRGFLPQTKGHARYDAFEVARMFIMRTLSDTGMGPIWSKNFSSKAAKSLVFHALGYMEAFQDRRGLLENQDQIDDIRSTLVDKEFRPTYMIKWADLEIEFCNDVGEVFTREHPSTFLRQEQPVTVLNLKMMGAKFSALSPHPFIRLLSTEEADKLGRSPRR